LLEPDAGKLARPVLKGAGHSNVPGLPDSSEFVAKDSRAPAKPEQRVVADAIVSSEAMRNANAIVATGALSS